MTSAKPLQVLVPDQAMKFNAVLDYATAYGDFHATGYRQAAERLLERFLADPEGMAGEQDSLVLPILFLFRHYLELRFKEIIVYGQLLLGQSASWPDRQHDLRTLWVQVVELCNAVYGSATSEDFALIERCVSDLCQLDSKSATSFRYPRDHRGRPGFERAVIDLQSHVVIGLKSLTGTIKSVGDFLDGTSIEMSVWVDQQQP